MNSLDWIVLAGTLAAIVFYGMWKSRGVSDVETYFRGSNTQSWPTIGLGIMATQASAITFLSTPGQAYEDGMRFVQFYFGLPLAMIVICAVFVPIYYKLKVYTAYEYLEHRFDVRVRYLGALLFLIQRGLAAGITLYAPAIILSTVLGWSLTITNLVMGVLVIIYTMSGGIEAVSQTQKQQMIVMLGGMALAVVMIVWRLPDSVSFGTAVKMAGSLGKMNIVSFEFDPNSRYTIWSGLTGGFFLALSYFGTDQSQVQRYLSGRSVAESRLGLLFNGMFKIPMQAGILFAGVMLVVFYLFVQPPIFFNAPALQKVLASDKGPELQAITTAYDQAFLEQRLAAEAFAKAPDGSLLEAKVALQEKAAAVNKLRSEAKSVIAATLPKAESKDGDYIFVSFVLKYLPAGLVGLLIAVILCAAMSSIAAELAALGSTTTMDLYRRILKRPDDKERDLRMSKLFTVMWGGVALGFASFAALLDNLIEAVNILGSLFYGTVLGIFVVGFFIKRVGAQAVLLGAAAALTTVFTLYFSSDLGYLWYNVVGCAVVVAVAMAVTPFLDTKKAAR